MITVVLTLIRRKIHYGGGVRAASGARAFGQHLPRRGVRRSAARSSGLSVLPGRAAQVAEGPNGSPSRTAAQATAKRRATVMAPRRSRRRSSGHAWTGMTRGGGERHRLGRPGTTPHARTIRPRCRRTRTSRTGRYMTCISPSTQSGWHCCIKRLRDHEAANLPAYVHSAAVARSRRRPGRLPGTHGAYAHEKSSCRMITRLLNATAPLYVLVRLTVTHEDLAGEAADLPCHSALGTAAGRGRRRAPRP